MKKEWSEKRAYKFYSMTVYMAWKFIRDKFTKTDKLFMDESGHCYIRLNENAVTYGLCDCLYFLNTRKKLLSDANVDYMRSAISAFAPRKSMYKWPLTKKGAASRVKFCERMMKMEKEMKHGK